MILVQEANLDYDVRDYRRLFDPVVNENADVVYGTRFFGQTHRVFNYRHYMGAPYSVGGCEELRCGRSTRR